MTTMICVLCGRAGIRWIGPLSNLTHTECPHCGGRNCQRAEAPTEDADAEFDNWMRQVNAEVDRITGGIGFSSDDFRDWEYRDAFDNGVEPIEAARQALAEDVTGRGLLELAGIDPDELEL